MEMSKDPEFKKMIGIRIKLSDGFTYIYGAIKDGSTVRPASKSTKRCIRADKKHIKNIHDTELKRELNELESEVN